MIAIRLAIRLSGNLFILSFSESLTKFRQQILSFGIPKFSLRGDSI